MNEKYLLNINSIQIAIKYNRITKLLIIGGHIKGINLMRTLIKQNFNIEDINYLEIKNYRCRFVEKYYSSLKFDDVIDNLKTLFKIEHVKNLGRIMR